MKKIHLLLNCRSRRETVVIGGKEWDLNLRVQNSCLSPFPMCQDMWPSCPLSSQLIKMRVWLHHVIWMFWAGDKSILPCFWFWFDFFFFQSVLNTAVISAISWHVSVVSEAGLGLWLYRHRVTLVTYWIIVSSSSQPAGVRLTVPMGWEVGIWQLTCITFSVIFVLMRNWAEDKSRQKIFLSSGDGPPLKDRPYSSSFILFFLLFFDSLCMEIFLAKMKVTLLCLQCSVSSF